ncbi:DUF6368 family protein [Streptomyces sp. Lzd4kr]|nr:DUF6368 family protein [Streptomyces sp. Lzd4kr]
MGPAVGLWLFGERRSMRESVSGVLPWLETFCAPVDVQADGSVDFRVRDPAVLGPRIDAGGAGKFFLTEDDCLPSDDEDYSAFPSPPTQGLVLGAYSSGPVNHVLVGHLALELARRWNTPIDFDGLLAYPFARDESPDPADLDRARALVASLPGAIAEVSYATGGGGRWMRHVGDAEFLAAWLRHPQFRLP